MPELTAEPLSPELILVSPPEVAALAREQLPDPQQSVSNGRRSEPVRSDASEATWNDFLADVRNRPAEPVGDPQRIPRPPVRIRRDGRKRLLVAMVALLGVAAVVGLGWARDRGHQRPGASASSPTVPSHTREIAPRPAKPSSHAKTTAVPAVKAAPKPAKPASRAKTTPVRPAKAAPKRAKPVSAAKTKPRPAVTAAPNPKTSKQRPSRRRGFVPARVWSWAPAAGASTYVVRFLRDGHKVLRIRTGGPRLHLPSSFAFTPGRYRWTVTAIPSTGTGAHVIVNSAFTVG